MSIGILLLLLCLILDKAEAGEPFQDVEPNLARTRGREVYTFKPYKGNVL